MGRGRDGKTGWEMGVLVERGTSGNNGREGKMVRGRL